MVGLENRRGSTKLFVSYSHQDLEWLNRLRLHLSLLERQRIVQVWSDTGIGVGAPWREDLENALSDSRAAVLLVSPAFLASDFIWNFEMPRILAHSEQGMDVFPLIARPCAWQLAPDLAAIQARPSNDGALSLGTDAEVDRELAKFTYEIADLLGRLPGGFSSKGAHLLQTAASGRTVSANARSTTSDTQLLSVGASWSGTYPETNRRLRLSVNEKRGAQFRATIDYLDDGSVTEVEGHILEAGEVRVDQLLRSILTKVPTHEVAVEFQEKRQSKKGKRAVDLNGEYRAVISGDVMFGNWSSDGRTVGTFELRRDT